MGGMPGRMFGGMGGPYGAGMPSRFRGPYGQGGMQGMARQGPDRFSGMSRFGAYGGGFPGNGLDHRFSRFMGQGRGPRPFPGHDMVPPNQFGEVDAPVMPGDMPGPGMGMMSGAEMARRSRHETYPGLTEESCRDVIRCIRRAERYNGRGRHGHGRIKPAKAALYSALAGKMLHEQGITPDAFGGIYAPYLDAFANPSAPMNIEDEYMLFMNGSLRTGRRQRSKYGHGFLPPDGSRHSGSALGSPSRYLPRRRPRMGYHSDSSTSTSSSENE